MVECTWHVSPDGNDTWSGRRSTPNTAGTDGPLATLACAVEAARAVSNDNPRRIVVHGGEYYDVAAELDARDSGLSIEAAEGERPVLYGGRPVGGWQKEEKGEFWYASLPGLAEGKWDLRMLVVNGRFCPRARLPEEGAFTHESVFDVRWMSSTYGGWERKPTEQELTTLRYKEGDLGSWLDVRNAELTIYHAWDDSTVGLTAIDPTTRTVTFSNTAGHPAGAFASWNAHARTYVVWNVREGMTRPGQWYLDRAAGRVVYWPLPGEQMGQVQVLAPTVPCILRLHAPEGSTIEKVTIQGLTLSLTSTPLIAAGFGASALDGAITAVTQGSLSDCRFLNLVICNVAGHAIKIRGRRNRSVAVADGEFTHIGAGGIYFTADDGLITGNLVQHAGLIYPAAIGIFFSGNRVEVSHNELSDCSYTGIDGSGTGHDIAYNDMRRVMQVLNDGAAIYTIYCRESVLRGNVARDIGGGPGDRHAYYLDELSQGCSVVGNLAVGVGSPTHNHMASHNRIEENVFVHHGDMRWVFVRSDDFTAARNVAYAQGAVQFVNMDAIQAFRDNVIYSAEGRVEAVHRDSTRSLVDAVPISSTGIVQKDPLFVDPEHGDFRFRPGSPAEQLGIPSLDVSQAGRSRHGLPADWPRHRMATHVVPPLNPPPLREELCLNGAWEAGGEVPVYTGIKLDRQTYRRQVAIPASWEGKRIWVEFSKVNHAADVYVDDQIVGSHIGGWIPFGLDITSHVRPGAEFTLRVEVKGSAQHPVVDEEGNPQWPLGAYNLDGSNSGIVDDVWLRAYGSVHVEDAFIQSSYRTRTLTVDYTMRNHDSVPRVVRLMADLVHAGSDTLERAIVGPSVPLAPGETKTVRITEPWPDPALWMPDQPDLYILRSRLMDRQVCVDQEARRFGFREVWIEGNQFMLNGVRVNLWGDNIPMAWFQHYSANEFVSPQTWPSTVDMLKELNIRVVRFHQSPAPDFVLDVADAKGLLIIDESAMYGRPWYQNKQPILDNVRHRWTGAWIRAHRNHPSVFMWSAENEMVHHVPWLTAEEALSLGDAIRRYDSTRPVTHDGDADVGDAVINLHYPEGYEKEPTGSTYSWARLVRPDKPTGLGEFITSYAAYRDRNIWWQGTWTRGARYAGFTDIRPFKLEWAWQDMEAGARANLRNSLAPVALFDKDYDDLGIEPLIGRSCPSLGAGTEVQRTLVLYNDDFRDTRLTIAVTLQINGQTHSCWREPFTVPLGEHLDIAYLLRVPDAAGSRLEMVLTVDKGETQRFREVYSFEIR